MAIFGQIGARVSNLGNQVAGKTKGSLEQVKLDNEIREKEREIQARYAVLGCIYYEMKRGIGQGDLDCEPVMRQIDKMRQEIREGQQRIEEIKSRVTCPNCGYALPAGTKFCPNCGASVERYRDHMIQGEDNPNVCPNCGATVEPGSAFCTSCGTRLPETAAHMEKLHAEEPVEGPTQQKMINKCPNCGAALEEGAMFCTSCGQKVGENAKHVSADSEPVKEKEQAEDNSETMDE